MITCQVEPFAQCADEMEKLFPLHYDEISLHRQQGIPYAPQREVYLRDEALGICCCIVMRALGRIIGYWIHFISPGRHYAGCLTSITDIFFIHPEYRSGANALRLMHAVEAENRRRGVKLWFAGEKLHAPVGRLFAACGFEPVERTWAKWL